MTATLATSRPLPTRWPWSALAIGLVALVVCAVAAQRYPAPFFRAYLVAWLFFLGLALGSLVLVMIHHLTGGVWGLVMGRIWEAQMRTLPLMALLFVPIALNLSHVFPWAHETAEAAVGLHRFRANYLVRDYFWARSAAYFALWILLASCLSHWSRIHDSAASARTAWKCQTLSGPGLVIYGISLHFAAIDWIMSLEPAFTSTIFGPIVAASQLLSALAFALLAFTLLASLSQYDEVFSLKVLHDIGNLLFTLVTVWAYLVWCQFMLIWISDLPRDNVWLLARSRGGWQWMALALVFLHFALPFFALLFRAVKQNLRALRAVAALLLAMQLVFTHFQVVPWFSTALCVHWLDVVAALGIGGVWLAAFLWLLNRRPLVPRGDRNWPAALHLRHLDSEEAAQQETLAHA